MDKCESCAKEVNKNVETQPCEREPFQEQYHITYECEHCGYEYNEIEYY